MKAPRILFSLLSSAGVFASGLATAQIPVTVTTDIQGALSYVQDATNQVQNLQQWGSQYMQMAQQVRQYSTQIQQYSDMLKRVGDPSTVLHVTGLDGVVRSVNGIHLQYEQLQGGLTGMGYQFQSLGGSDGASGNPHAWSQAAGSFSLGYSTSGEPLDQTYQGKLVESNYAGYASTEKAFDAYVKAAYDSRKEAGDSVGEMSRLTAELENATDEATVAKVTGAIHAKQAVADASARVEEKAARDVMVADTMRRLEAEKKAQAESEALVLNAEDIAQAVLAEERADLQARSKKRAERLKALEAGGPKLKTPVGIQ